MNWDWGLIGTILAIIFGIATIISIIIAIRLARRRIPVWGYETKKLIGLGTDAPPELKLIFNGKEVSEVFRTRLLFFNRGNEDIRREDISRPITLMVDGATILHEPTFTSSTKEVEFSARQSVDYSIELDFRYLDHNDGGVVEILHTKYDGVRCEGNIIGAGKPRYIGKIDLIRPKLHGRRIIALIVLLLFPLLIIPLFITINSPIFKINSLWILIIIPVFWYNQFWFQSNSIFHYLKYPKWSHINE